MLKINKLLVCRKSFEKVKKTRQNVENKQTYEFEYLTKKIENDEKTRQTHISIFDWKNENGG